MEREALAFEDVAAGDLVPPFTVALTLQRLVMEAGANRDFAPMHHDRDEARASGAADVFANSTLLQTLTEVTLRRWMGLGGRIRRLSIKMNGPSYVGRDLTCAARVVGLRREAERGLVDLELWHDCAGARTVTGRAVVELPLRSR